MRCPEGVEVKLLHQADVSLHLLPCDALAAGLAMIMSVDSIKLYGNSVHQHLLSLNLDIPKADLTAAGLYKIGLPIQE